MDYFDFNKFSDETVIFITDYFVSKFNKDSLLFSSVMIKDMIKSLTYSISFGHCVATE